MNPVFTKSCGALLTLLACTLATAQSVTRVKSIETGTKAKVTGSITGRQYKDYVLKLSAGQKITVSLQGSGSKPSFNFLPPASAEAMFVGTESGEKYSSIVPDDGDYVVRVYLVRAMARRGETGKFTVNVSKSGTRLLPLDAKNDAKIPGTRFHATGPIDCKLKLFSDVTSCSGSVVRRERSSATVVLKSKSSRRTILFIGGKPVVSDARSAMKVRKTEYDTIVSFFDGDEEYTIPDALVLGG